MPSSAEIQHMLTGPGGPFEVVRETVNGIAMKTYRERMRSLREIAAVALGRGNDQVFLVYGDRRYGFQDFIELANSISWQLSSRYGVRAGDRVAVLSANNPEWCLTFWATVNMDGVLVGLNGWWKADEILYGLRDSAAKILVVDRDRFQRIAGRLAELPELDAIFLCDAEAPEPGNDPRLHRFEELLCAPSPALPADPIGEDDPAVIFYTSGTTGRPKGAISTHRSMVANLQNTLYNAMYNTLLNGAALLGGSGQSSSLLTAPLFHVSGCHSNLVVGLLGGLKIVVPVGKFDPEHALELIERERITVWAAVPTMVWRVVEHPARKKYDLSSIVSVAYGGSPSGRELQRRVQETFPNVRSIGNAYGLTESSSVATAIGGQEFLDRPSSVGRPMPVVDIKIADEAGNELPSGTPGEVWIKGPIVMPGYWRKPEATAQAITDGWLHTGDIGYLDSEGYLYITDRAKDMIIRGGENIYCVEIENRLLEHPKIADAAVIGVPHPVLGEEVKAVIQAEPGQSLDEREVRSWVAETLADFKVPAYVEIRTQRLPRNASGKLLKNVLRGEGEVAFEETM